MSRPKGSTNRRTFRMSQHVTYQGRNAEIINNTMYTLSKKVKIQMMDTKEWLVVAETDLVKGWK